MRRIMLLFTGVCLLAAMGMTGCRKKVTDDPILDPSSSGSGTDISAQTETASETGAEDTETEETVERTSGKIGGRNTTTKKNAPTGTSRATTKGTSGTTTTKAPTEIRVTIPEGFSIPQIAKRLEEKKVCSAAEFVKQVNEYDFTYYPLINAIPTQPEKCFKLEGYLFPNTYDFSIGANKSDAKKAQDAIGKMIRGLEAQIGKNGERITSNINDVHNILIMASIIEKEITGETNRQKVSAVFYNRLDIGMKLQADPTINYLERDCRSVGFDDTKVNHFAPLYNTYKCNALPAGPICSPGLESIEASDNPTKDFPFRYFAANSKDILFAMTLEEHDENCIKLGISTSKD